MTLSTLNSQRFLWQNCRVKAEGLWGNGGQIPALEFEMRESGNVFGAFAEQLFADHERSEPLKWARKAHLTEQG